MCGKLIRRALGLVIAGSVLLGSATLARADEQVYEKVMPSVALVVAPNGIGKVSFGTAVMVQTSQRVMVTAAHVIGTSKDVVVYAPEPDSTGTPVRNLNWYLSHPELGIKAKVVLCDAGHDLAVLVPEKMPLTMRPLKLAKLHALPGQAVYAIGNSGMWRYREGHVRQVGRMHIDSDHGPVEGDMIETDAPTNHGDSGGPVVNSFGELLGITHGISTTEKAVDYTIGVDEVTAVLGKLSPAVASTTQPDFPKIARVQDPANKTTPATLQPPAKLPKNAGSPAKKQ